MKLPRRKFLHLAAGAAALPALSRVAGAETYPTRPVRILVGYSAGSASDIIARLIAQWLSERLGQQFVVENRPGAGGNIAAEAVVRSAPAIRSSCPLRRMQSTPHCTRNSILISSATSRRSPALSACRT